MSRLLLAGAAAALMLGMPQAASADAGFHSSDPQLDAIWTASVKTARDMLVPGPIVRDAAERDCKFDEPVVILDGLKRDRCPWIGDEAVTGMTFLISTPSAVPAMRNMLLWFAHAQHRNGAIPASPLNGSTFVFYDYGSYWVQCLYDYVLYTGDLALAKTVWPNVLRLLNRWYPAQTRPDGLIVGKLGHFDYTFAPRLGKTIAYYTAVYALGLERAAKLARWVGKPAQARAWEKRESTLAEPFNAAFWDPDAGAYKDATEGAVVHPQDGNVFAILAGLAPRDRAVSALNFQNTVNYRGYGNTIVDRDVWRGVDWGTQGNERVMPFLSYFELLARFQTGADDTALNLIRREWGYMLANGPKSTMWEQIGPYGSIFGHPPSIDHGWSSGAAPALTNYVLGVRPTSPGFATFVVDPHPGVTSALVYAASGTVPTPHGEIFVGWHYDAKGKLVMEVHAPPGERWTNRP